MRSNILLKLKKRIMTIYRNDKEYFYVLLVLTSLVVGALIYGRVTAFDRARKSYESKNEIIYSKELKCGDVLYITRQEFAQAYFWPEYLSHKTFRRDYAGTGRRTTRLGARHMKQLSPNNYSAVRIFYPSRKEIPEIEGSYYTWFGKDQEELEYFICITPAHNRDERNGMLMPYSVPQEEWITPVDTKGTTPIHVVDDDGYPAWYFVLSADELRSDYTLFYGDQQLTYRDLMGFTWAEN